MVRLTSNVDDQSLTIVKKDMLYPKSSTLSYLKRHVPSDIRVINRLLVSAFIKCNGYKCPHSPFLSSHVISPDEEEYNLLLGFCSHLTSEFGGGMSLETLVKLFEFVVSPSDRIVTGAVYTPRRIRDAIVANCIGGKKAAELQKIRVADISCGCGGFLIDVASLIHQRTGKCYSDIFKENIFGIDIQEYAVERTKILLSLLAFSEGDDADFSFNLLCRDSLDCRNNDWDSVFSDFDVIVGNPPYVCSRNLSDATRAKLQGFEVCDTGHPDLYIPFFQIAIEMLNENGCLSYITMNTFLRSVNGRALRKYFSRNRYTISIIDFRGYQVFDSRNTYTCLFFLNKKTKSDLIRYSVDEKGLLSPNNQYIEISYDALDDIKGWALNNFENTHSFESLDIQIKDYCPSRHGIATLSNDTYIFQPVDEDRTCYYLESDGKKFPIEKGICRNVVNPNKLNSSEQFDSLIEKLIFPYNIIAGRAIIIDSETMKSIYPGALEYLNTKREILLLRDKGDTSSYPQWYAFGRTQSLVCPRFKLFYPKYSNRPLRCVIKDDPLLMWYNGLAFVNEDERRLRILKAIIETNLFWEYIMANGKPYASGYYSLTGVDIKHFGIPLLTNDEENELLSLTDKVSIEQWLRDRYK